MQIYEINLIQPWIVMIQGKVGQNLLMILFADIWWNWLTIFPAKTIVRTQCLPKDYFRPDVRASVHPVILFFSVPLLPVPSDSFLISKVTSRDTSAVSHPLLLPVSQPGCLMSEGLVIYRVTSRWRGTQAMGKETLRGHSSRKHSDVPYSHLAIYFLGMQIRGDSAHAHTKMIGLYCICSHRLIAFSLEVILVQAR